VQNDEAQAMRAVTDEMVLALSATGTPDDIALRLDALLQAGLKQAVLFPISADGDAKSAILRTIEFLSLRRRSTIPSGVRRRACRARHRQRADRGLL